MSVTGSGLLRKQHAKFSLQATLLQVISSIILANGNTLSALFTRHSHACHMLTMSVDICLACPVSVCCCTYETKGGGGVMERGEARGGWCSLFAFVHIRSAAPSSGEKWHGTPL